MASDAKAILSHPRSDASYQLSFVAGSLKQTGPSILLCLGAFAYAATVLGSLRLFDNDYDWINQAQDAGWFQILADIFRPIPERWGFQDRPVQVLCFKFLFGISGYSPEAYYTFKAALFATVSFGIVRVSLTLGLDRQSSILAGVIFAVSSPGQASALWISDFELLAEVFMLASFGVFWRILNSAPTASRTIEFFNQAMFVMLSIVAHRTKGSAKLIPAIVLIYLFLYRRDQIRRFLPAIILISLTIVPIFAVISDPVPPFAPFTEDRSQGWMWKPANLETISTLIAGNFHPIHGTSGPDIAFSILSVLTPALLWPAMVALVFLLVRSRKSFSLPGWRFLTVWAVVSVATYASFPRLPDGFMARYVVVGLVPISILISLTLATAASTFRAKIAVPVLIGILAIHASHNLNSTRHLRDALGQVIVAHDQAREYVATQILDSDVLIIGFDYGYNRRIQDSNRYHREKLRIGSIEQKRPLHVLILTEQDLDAIEHQSTIQQIRLSVRFPKVEGRVKVGIKPIRTFPGLTDSFYDKHVYGMRQSFVGILYEMTYKLEKS